MNEAKWRIGKRITLKATENKEFKPNGGIHKEYPQACNGIREICALHTFTDGDVWLVFFNTGNGRWEKVRDATQEDKNFFDWHPFPTTIREVAFSEDKDIPDYLPVREDEAANESRSA